jgi:hypothetical protein
VSKPNSTHTVISDLDIPEFSKSDLIQTYLANSYMDYVDAKYIPNCPKEYLGGGSFVIDDLTLGDDIAAILHNNVNNVDINAANDAENSVNNPSTFAISNNLDLEKISYPPLTDFDSPVTSPFSRSSSPMTTRPPPRRNFPMTLPISHPVPSPKLGPLTMPTCCSHVHNKFDLLVWFEICELAPNGE